MAIVITREKIRRRNRRAALTALAPAIVSGLIAGVVAGVVADTPTAVTVIVVFLASLLAALLSAGLAGLPTVSRTTWHSKWMPTLAALLCAVIASGVGLVIALIREVSVVLPAVLPLLTGAGVAIYKSRPIGNRPLPVPPAAPVARRVEQKPPVVTNSGLTVRTPRKSLCPAGCGKPLTPGQRFMVCTQKEEHKVHSECGTALCLSKCPECGHPLR